MKASDIMVTSVITVGPNTLVQDVVMTLLSNRISAVPVLDEHRVVIGIVSEADLIRHVEISTEQNEFLKLRGANSADIMSKPVITASPEMPLSELVTLFNKNRIKRVPIVEEEKIIGIVSRANLLRALALSHKALTQETISSAA